MKSADWYAISRWDRLPNLHTWETWELSGHAAEQSAQFALFTQTVGAFFTQAAFPEQSVLGNSPTPPQGSQYFEV